jgi:hypothetical protein
MALAHDIVILGTSSINDDGVSTVQAVSPVGDDDSDVESFGEIDQYQALGLSSAPWPKDADGYAEGVILRNCGNRDALLIGGRDTRSGKIVGKLKPGDTVLHTTGPQQAAQVQLKEEKRTVSIVTKDSSGDGVLVNLDGTTDNVQIFAFGQAFQMSKSDGITLTDGKAGLIIKDGVISLFGTVVLGGMTPNPAMCLMLGLPTGSPGGPASTPMVAAKGVWIGM